MLKRGLTSPLDLLAMHQKQSLVAWLTTGGKDGAGISYVAAVKRLGVEFGVKTNPASLCNWRLRTIRLAGMANTALASKTVVRSPLDRLPSEVRHELFTWLTTGGANGRGMSYKDAARRLAERHGVRVGASALHLFFHRYHKTERIPVARVTTNEIGDVKTITLETTAGARVETTQDAAARTLTLKITLPAS